MSEEHLDVGSVAGVVRLQEDHMGTWALTLRSALSGLIGLTMLTIEADAQFSPPIGSSPNMFYQPRPDFQNQPASRCNTGPIGPMWNDLGEVSENGEVLQVYVNDTTIQRVDYFARNANRKVPYLTVTIQFRDAEDTLQNRTEKVMLDGRGEIVLISKHGPRVNYYLTEGALRADVDKYLQPIPPGSAYSMLEQHLRIAGCF